MLFGFPPVHGNMTRPIHHLSRTAGSPTPLKACVSFISGRLLRGKRRPLGRAPKDAGLVNVTVQGTFLNCGHCGHLNGYLYKFVAHKIRDVAVVSRGMKTLEEEQKAARKWGCGGTHPK